MNSVVSSTTHVAAQLTALPLVVDGDKNPEQIPEALAYRHFISLTSVRQDASTTELDRRDAFMAGLLLSRTDRKAYVEAVKGVRDQLTSLEQRARTAAHSDIATADSARREREALLDATADRVRASLSPSGAMVLRAYINDHVKRRIKIYAQAQ